MVRCRLQCCSWPARRKAAMKSVVVRSTKPKTCAMHHRCPNKFMTDFSSPSYHKCLMECSIKRFSCDEMRFDSDLQHLSA